MTKPYLIKKELKDIEVQGVKITLKKLKYGKSREAMTIALKVDPVKGTAVMDSGLLATLRALYQIADWELTDENDEKLPIELNTLDNLLDEDFVQEMIQEINTHGTKQSELSADEKKS